jgi:3-oxoacyl-[acyl-carrier protein] reductase
MNGPRRVALLTGGARGIARAIALDLAQAGWSIALCYRTSKDDADSAVHAIEAAGSQALAVQCDVSDPAASAALVRRVEDTWGRIDALVNGAGPYHRVPILDETAEGWRGMFDNNLHPVFDLAKAVAPGMKARGWGRILSFSMANADRMQANPQVTAHYIAKIGVIVLSRTLARVLAPWGITVNTIAPGFIDSGSAPTEELEQMLKNIPAKRLGTLDDAVAVARFLLSDDAAYVNGANIVCSGAWGL